MSLLTTPHRQNPQAQNSRTSDLHEAQDALELLRWSAERETQRNHAFNARFRNDTTDAFLEFTLPKAPDTAQAEALANAEEKIVQLLRFSRVPGASGFRGVYVDLVTGTLLVGTTVFFNERNAALGVQDESLVHKIEMIAATLALASFESVPQQQTEVQDPIVIRIEGLSPNQLGRASVEIDGEVYSVRDIMENVDPGDVD